MEIFLSPKAKLKSCRPDKILDLHPVSVFQKMLFSWCFVHKMFSKVPTKTQDLSAPPPFCTYKLEVTNGKGESYQLLPKVKKAMKYDIHVHSHMYIMVNRLLQAWQISAIQESNSIYVIVYQFSCTSFFYQTIP